MNAGVDVKPQLPSRGADVSQYEYKIMYGKRDFKCARGKKCAYGGEGRIVKGQLRWESADFSKGVKLANSYHLRCLSDTSAINFLNRARLERDFREASEEEIIEGLLDGFHDVLEEDFHREGVKSVLLKLFKRKPIDEADHAFFNRVDLPSGVTLETAANETVKKLIQLGGGVGGDPEKETTTKKKKEKKTAVPKVKKASPASQSKRKTAPATTKKKTKEEPSLKAKGGAKKKKKKKSEKKEMHLVPG